MRHDFILSLKNVVGVKLPLHSKVSFTCQVHFPLSPILHAYVCDTA